MCHRYIKSLIYKGFKRPAIERQKLKKKKMNVLPFLVTIHVILAIGYNFKPHINAVN